jgi:hypothetical protein
VFIFIKIKCYKNIIINKIIFILLIEHIQTHTLKLNSDKFIKNELVAAFLLFFQYTTIFTMCISNSCIHKLIVYNIYQLFAILVVCFIYLFFYFSIKLLANKNNIKRNWI